MCLRELDLKNGKTVGFISPSWDSEYSTHKPSVDAVPLLIPSSDNAFAQSKILRLPPSFTRDEFIPRRAKRVAKHKRRSMALGILHPEQELWRGDLVAELRQWLFDLLSDGNWEEKIYSTPK